jgi:hypothetical protein
MPLGQMSFTDVEISIFFAVFKINVAPRHQVLIHLESLCLGGKTKNHANKQNIQTNSLHQGN